MANSKLKQVELTIQEWWNALKTPSPTKNKKKYNSCLLYTSPSPRDRQKSRMPSSA